MRHDGGIAIEEPQVHMCPSCASPSLDLILMIAALVMSTDAVSRLRTSAFQRGFPLCTRVKSLKHSVGAAPRRIDTVHKVPLRKLSKCLRFVEQQCMLSRAHQ